jgi:hypothetical protein
MDSVVEVYREPDVSAGRYRTLVTLQAGDLLATPLLPGFSLDVAIILGG